MNLRLKLAASAAMAGLLAASGTAQAEQSVAAADAAALNQVVVTSKRAAPTALHEVPGGTSVVAAEQLQPQRIATLSDALEYVPGVFAQSISGGEGTLLSVRGSGLTKGGFTYGNGVQVLFDGVPITSIYGTPYESFEPNVVSRVEIYKGANAFEFGATQLGGVINFIQHTGRDSDPLFVRLEGGSFGYQRQQLSSGQVVGPFDYYVSLTHFETGGYRQNSAASSGRLFANFGWQITPNLRTQVYFSDSRQYQLNQGALTWAQLQANPQQNPFTGARVNMGSVVVGSKTTWTVDEHSNVELGLSYKSTPLHNGNLPQRTFWDVADWSAQLKYRRDDVWLGHESKTTVAYIGNFATPHSGATVTNDTTGAVLGKVKYDGSNSTVLVSNDLAVTPNLWLLTGLAWIHQKRINSILNPVAAGLNPNANLTYDNTTPRIGFRYDATANISVYGNFSRLIEAPQTISLTTSANGAYTGFTTAGLKAQRGDSYEIGFRGGFDRVSWDIDYFNEQLTNELLTVYTTLPNVDPRNPNGITATTNAAPTVKEGIEAAANVVLWRDGASRLSLRQAYTWSNFHFKSQNAALGQAVEPRQPRQFYQAGLSFNHATGVYASLDLESVLTSYPVDYVNKTFAPSYAIWGATIGYADPKGKWRVFLQGQNLGDKTYASSASATFQAVATSAIYTPGVGRTITAGLTYAF